MFPFFPQTVQTGSVVQPTPYQEVQDASSPELKRTKHETHYIYYVKQFYKHTAFINFTPNVF